MSGKLPLEIIESIVDCLATQDDELFSSIKACSLVSRRFLPRARSYIFSSIVIEPRYNRVYTSCWMFECLISRSPEIAYYVTSLHFGIGEGDFDNLEGWDTAGLASALSSLTRLKSLSLSMDYASWKDLTIIVKDPILNLMHLPTLSHLKLHSFFDFELSDLTLCVGLKHLDVASCNTDVGNLIEVYQGNPSRLESFEGAASPEGGGQTLLQLCTARRTDGKPVVDATGLRKLCLDIHEDYLDELKELFKHLTQLTNFKMFSKYT